MPFWYTIFSLSPYPWKGTSPPTPPPPSFALLSRFGPPLKNPGYTAVTAVDRSLKIEKIREWYNATTHNIPLIIIFNVQNKIHFDTTNFQKSPYRGRGTPPPPPHTHTPLGRFAPLLCVLPPPPPPQLKNPGYATAQKRTTSSNKMDPG